MEGIETRSVPSINTLKSLRIKCIANPFNLNHIAFLYELPLIDEGP